jgi:hypothetical protein
MSVLLVQRPRVENALRFADKEQNRRVPEYARLVELESVIGRGLKSFVEVGLALKEIRDNRLYREQHANFEDYCQRRWGMSRIQGHRLIEAAEVSADLLPIGNTLLTCEAQARELVPLSQEMRRKVWTVVIAAGSPPPTARRIREVIHEVRIRDIAGTANGKSSPPDKDEQDDVEWIKYSLRATVSVAADTDPNELEALIRTGQVHWVLKNERNKTLAVVEMEAVESLERLTGDQL